MKTGWEELIAQHDRSGVLSVLRNFPSQVARALTLRATPTRRPANILLAGMGGSALGAQVVGDLLQGTLEIPFFLHRDYGLPGFVGENTLVFAVSYSGNTEETISAAREALHRGSEVIAITSGGELKRVAEDAQASLIELPTDIVKPRMGWAYLSLPIVQSLSSIGLADFQGDHLQKHLAVRQLEYDPSRPSNIASNLAEAIQPFVPVFYSSSGWGLAAYKWKINLNENSKHLAFANFFPELNHNEIVGWEHPTGVLRSMAIIVLRSEFESDLMKRRVDATLDLIRHSAGQILEVYASGNSRLEQYFDLIYHGDFVSYYLALLNGEDPAPVSRIDTLRERISQ